MSEEIKPTIFDIVFRKITNKKLNGDNFLQWKRVVEIHVIWRELRITATIPMSKGADLETG